jgi:hypothetical protein
VPIIREYGQQVRAPGPSEKNYATPAQFGAASAQGLQALGQAVSQVGSILSQREEQENLSDITAKTAKANADLALDFQQVMRTAEPGDKTAFEEYNKRVEGTLGKVGENATTGPARRFFAEASERIKGQLFRSADAGQADLAGVKAETDYTDTFNNLSSTVMADPSSLQLQRDLHSAAVENLVQSGLLPVAKARELQADGDNKLVKASVRGWTQLNPEYAKQKLDSGEYDADLGADGKAQMYGEVDQAVRARLAEQERMIRLQERERELAQRSTQNGLLKKFVDNTLNEKDILNSNLEPFGSGSKDQFIGMLERANSSGKALQTNPNVMMSLFRKIHLPDGDPDKILDENALNEYVGRGLSFTDLNRLRDEMQGLNTEAGKVEATMKKQVFDFARSKLSKANPLLGLRDPEGEENVLNYMNFFYQEYAEQRKQGVPASKLLNPESPDYLGKYVHNFAKTPQEILNSSMRRKTVTPLPISGASAEKKAQSPRGAGESAADYLKRIKGGG